MMNHPGKTEKKEVTNIETGPWIGPGTDKAAPCLVNIQQGYLKTRNVLPQKESLIFALDLEKTKAGSVGDRLDPEDFVAGGAAWKNDI